MKRMSAKYAGRCRRCGAAIAVGDLIHWSRATGSVCADREMCAYADSVAEQAAEMEMEAWAEARMTGTTSTYWEDRDYRRERRYADAEVRRGMAETAYAQQAGPAGSAAREAAYLEMERAAYNRGED